MSTERLYEGVYRILIPFNSIYTTVFLLTEGNNAIIFDSGNSGDDAAKYIIPFVKRLSLKVKYILLSHSHSDHAGGYQRLAFEYPLAEKVDFSVGSSFHDGDILLGRFMLLLMRGHTEDGLAVFDIETKTLFTADALQQRGIDIYRGGVNNRAGYLSDIQKVERLAPRAVIASHDYDPLGFIVQGEEEIARLLKLCKFSM